MARGADLAGERLGDLRAHELLEEDGGHPVLLRLGRDLGQPPGRGLVLGGEPGDGDLLQTVRVGQVAEGVVAGDDLAALAGLEAGAQLVVEGGQLGAQLLRALAVAVGAVRVDLGEPVGQRRADRGQALGVEPDVRVAALLGVLLVLGVLLALGVLLLAQLDGRQHVERAVGGLLLDGLVDGGLEAGGVDDEVGLAKRADLLRRELEVVRLAAGLGEVRDLDVVAADPLGQEGVRVEAGRHRGAALVGGARPSPPSPPHAVSDEDGGQGGGGEAHDTTLADLTTVTNKGDDPHPYAGGAMSSRCRTSARPAR